MVTMKVTPIIPDWKSPEEKAIDVALETIGKFAETAAKLNLERSPRRVDTGTLRDSITSTTDGMYAYVGTNIEYGPYVEFGTVKMAPNKFLRRAVKENIDEYVRIIENALAHAYD